MSGYRPTWEQVGEWRVAFAPGAPRQAVCAILQDLARGTLPGGAETVKQSRVRHVMRVPLADGSALFVKHSNRWGARRPLAWLGARSRALEEFVNLRRVRTLGMAAVEPLACAERREQGQLEEAVLVTRELPRAALLPEALARLSEPARAELVAALGRSIRALHDAGFWHRDLHAGNVLVGGHEAGQPVLVDVQKLRWLRVPLPGALRARDLAMLGAEPGGVPGLLESYAHSGRRLQDHTGLRRRVVRAKSRRTRARLRSRGRRCVRSSTGFRIERHEHLRVYRRADIELKALLGAINVHRERTSVASGATRRGDPPVTRVADVKGGPPPDSFARGQGRPEPGSPSKGAVAVREFDESLTARLSHFVPGPRGLTAWRRAHAALLRGIETPAPLALVEETRRSRRVCSHLVVRWDDRARCLGAVLAEADAEEAAPLVRAVGRFLARLHEAGLCHRQLGVDCLLVRRDPGADESAAPALSLLALQPEEIRVATRVSARRRARQTARLAAELAERTDLPRSKLEQLLAR